jgi:predicted Rossmann fold flavoprotein
MQKAIDIIIIGAGASGMAAAITAARTNPQACILILEKKEAPGKKLLATGNGRCNITNSACKGYRETLRFFESTGLLIREEEAGRMYPYTGKAGDVVRALVRTAKALGVTILCGAAAESVSGTASGYSVSLTDGREFTCKRLLIAAGGKAGPQYGTSGDAGRLARSLGHSLTALAPALTSIETEQSGDSMKGLRAKARVSLYLTKGENEVLLGSEEGEVQFTEKGISGICVFNLSSLISLADGKEFGDYEVSLDFATDMDRKTLERCINERYEIEGMTAGEILSGIVDDRVAERILRRADANSAEQLSQCLKDHRLKVCGAGGWKNAQVTRGGVPGAEVDPETMESKVSPGLYLSGEVLDYDGPCGGFNLQHAWETGMAAGRAMGGK